MFGRKSKFALAGVAVIAAIAACLSIFQTPIKARVLSFAMPQTYFTHFNTIKPALYQVSGSVYAFEAGFARSLVLRTSDGVAVFDTFSTKHAVEMKEAIEHEFPGEEVRWVVHSHNHLDHIRGSDLFEGARVIGHEDLNQLVGDWPDAAQSVALTTQSLSGDQTITLGGIDVEALYMPFSHSHTMYGFRIPSEDVVFAADMMFVDTVPPFGFPDFYYPGYIRALDRLIDLDAAHYVPSHGWRGDRDDLIAFREMTVGFHSLIEKELLARLDRAEEDATIGEILRVAYPALKEKYGDWHGFEEMFVAKFGRHLGGVFLGY
ncbi:MAG: MBL fold metallo-hydrolase [Rhodobacteraceae bacterium]|nr:MBL fold metallo-hydrolase [Paracoccaceae bacterium]